MSRPKVVLSILDNASSNWVGMNVEGSSHVVVIITDQTGLRAILSHFSASLVLSIEVLAILTVMTSHAVGKLSDRIYKEQLMAVVRHDGKGLDRIGWFSFDFGSEKLQVLSLFFSSIEVPFFVVPPPELVDGISRMNNQTTR